MDTGLVSQSDGWAGVSDEVAPRDQAAYSRLRPSRSWGCSKSFWGTDSVAQRGACRPELTTHLAAPGRTFVSGGRDPRAGGGFEDPRRPKLTTLVAPSRLPGRLRASS